jgi:hypothetical protein
LKKPARIFPLICLSLLFSCAGNPSQPLILPSTPEPETPPAVYRIVDHQNQALEKEIPEWVDVYLEGGIPALEALPAFQGKYLFMGENTGTNLRALFQWSEGFSVRQDLPRLVAARVQARISRIGAGRADAEYGRFYERAVKESADAVFIGAEREAAFWVLKAYDEPAADADAARKRYDHYILISIPRSTLEIQLNASFLRAAVDTNPSREQAAAVNRLQDAFYEGF